jgi:hypothetical protein
MKLLGDIFFIEEGNVGIGTTLPRTILDVNTGIIHVTNNIGINTTTPIVSFEVNKTDSILLPKGTSAERPSGIQGYIRYNTDTNQFEGFGAGNTWGSLGGVKSTDQFTYISAELNAGDNDSNLRFFTSGIQQAIINPLGNLGIGTALPQEKLHVEGTILTNLVNSDRIVTSNLSTSNFTILQNFYYVPENEYVRTHYQINPTRFTTVITQEGISIFNFIVDGLYAFIPQNTEVYQNGYKLAYYTSNIKDYDVSYVNNEITTSITVTLSEPTQYNDIIDMYLWPSYISQDGTLQPGYVIQNIDYTYWQRTDSVTSNLYYTAGNVGIGTTINQGKLDIAGNMFITGNIYPTACNVYDLGSRDLRFKDIYLSGNSINLGDTIISRNGEEGGKLKITDLEGNLLDITTNNIVIPGSIGIGTTSYVQPLHVEGSSYIAGNVGIGTTQPRERLDIVNGNMIITGSIGIGTTLPFVSLTFNKTDSILLPKGTNNERPEGVQGYIRYNTDTNQFEGFGAGNTWGSLGGVKSTDQFTYITAELTPGTNDSNIRFYTGSHLQAILNPDGNLGIGTETPNQKLVIAGNAYVSETLFASNLTVFGTSTILNTITSNSEQMVIINNGTGPALKVTQTGEHPVAEFYDQESGIALFIGNHGNLGIGTTETQVSLVINRSDSVLLPKGTNDQRPEGVQGYIRYNTETSQFEGFGAGNTWGSLGGVKSTDQFTYITAELTPGTNDSNIRFYTGSHLQAILNPDGNLGIGTETPNQKLVVEGNVYVSETLFASNLTVFGTSTILNTITSNSEQMVIINNGTGPALKVTQTGDNPVAEFYDQESGIALFIGNHGNLGIGTTEAQVSLVINRSDSILLPKGTNDQRPEGVQGYIRYNTETSQFEGFGAGNTWGSLGGVKSTDQFTYITAELTPGTNDSNIRFYTGSHLQAILNPLGNLGIGTTLPTQKLHVEGTIYAPFITSSNVISINTTSSNIISNYATLDNIINSNLIVYGELQFGPNSSTLKTNLQVNPIRKTIYINTDSSNVFYVDTPGVYNAYTSNVHVFVNQTLQMSLNEDILDYTVNSLYTSDPPKTTFIISLIKPAVYGDIVDITVWPQIIQQTASEPGYVYQQIRVSETHFDVVNGINLAFAPGNIGIGTNDASLGRLVVAGNIVPSACNVFDLGTSNLRFRELYLSGNTIDLGGTKISRDLNNGSLNVLTTSGLPTDINAKSIYITDSFHIASNLYTITKEGNVGIGTTNPQAYLHIIETCNIHPFRVDDPKTNTTPFIIRENGNVGIGTTNPLAKLAVQGNIIASSDIVAFGTASDERLKTNVTDLENGLSIINKLRPVNFRWKDDIPNSYCNMNDYGLIAQEVEQIIPELTFSASLGIKYDPIKMIHYDKITTFLIKAIQEQQKQIDHLYSLLQKH